MIINLTNEKKWWLKTFGCVSALFALSINTFANTTDFTQESGPFPMDCADVSKPALDRVNKRRHDSLALSNTYEQEAKDLRMYLADTATSATIAKTSLVISSLALTYLNTGYIFYASNAVYELLRNNKDLEDFFTATPGGITWGKMYNPYITFNSYNINSDLSYFQKAEIAINNNRDKLLANVNSKLNVALHYAGLNLDRPKEEILVRLASAELKSKLFKIENQYTETVLKAYNQQCHYRHQETQNYQYASRSQAPVKSNIGTSTPGSSQPAQLPTDNPTGAK